MARPCLYTRELSDRAIEMLTEGMSMLAISKLDEMPSRWTMKQWVANDVDGFADRYYRAQSLRIDQMVDDTIDIADGIDGATGDELDPSNKKVRIEARRWVAAKFNRVKYGEHVSLDVKTATVAGSDDAALLAIALGSRSRGAAPEDC